MPRWPKQHPRPGIDAYGRTELWWLAFSGDLAGVRRQLRAGADPNAGDDVGYTPLHVAIQEERSAVVRLLLEKGADPNQADDYGNVPLRTAGGSDEMVLLLLRAGADPTITNHYRRMPFYGLVAQGGEVRKLVLEFAKRKKKARKRDAMSARRRKFGARRFEFVEGASQRFWEIRLQGKQQIIRFGRIGTEGQTTTRSFSDLPAARVSTSKLIREKIRKGYKEVKS